MTRLDQLVESSVVARACRPVIAGSALCAAIAGVVQVLRVADVRIAAGLGAVRAPDEDVRVATALGEVLNSSRVLRAIERILVAPSLASPDARVTRVLRTITGVDATMRVRLIAGGLAATVLSHAITMTVMGVPGGTLAWSVRVAAIVASAAAWRRPQPIAAAWEYRRTRPSPNRG